MPKAKKAAKIQAAGVGGSLGGVLDNPAIRDVLVKQGVEALIAWILGQFNKKPKVPAIPVTEPTPSPVQPDTDFPDDVIPAPEPTRKVTTVRLKLSRAQYNRQRFPEKYTPDNPMGLYSQDELRAIEAGTGTLNYGSKFWLDLTAYDAAGKEFLRDAVLSHGLAFKTEHRCGGAYIVGKGAQANGEPKPGYQTNDTDEVGNGITAWLSSLGFLHQMKAHGEGEFACSGKVDGVAANEFTIRSS
jgi:hypothetical protein